MIAVRFLFEQIAAAGVTLSIDRGNSAISCDPRGQLPAEVQAAVRGNVQAILVWHAVGQVIDPARLGVLLFWVEGNRPDLFEAEEEAGLSLAEAWGSGGRKLFVEALDRWTAIIRQALSEALEERPALLEGKVPIWLWWMRYTARGSLMTSPLSELFKIEVGLPSDDEADIVVRDPSPISSGTKEQEVVSCEITS